MRGVVIFGPVGTDKTHLPAATATAFDEGMSYRPDKEEDPPATPEDLVELFAAFRRGEFDDGPPLDIVYLTPAEMGKQADVQYWPILSLLRELRSDVMSNRRDTEHYCCSCHLLLIDDLGAERTTDYTLEELENIVDTRYRRDLPIAVTSNLTPDEIQARYGNRMLSRWTETCTIITIDGDDYRMDNANPSTVSASSTL